MNEAINKVYYTTKQLRKHVVDSSVWNYRLGTGQEKDLIVLIVRLDLFSLQKP